MKGTMFSKSFRWPLQINLTQVMLHICYLCKTGVSTATRLWDGQLGYCGLIPSSSKISSPKHPDQSHRPSSLLFQHFNDFYHSFQETFGALPSFRPLFPLFFLLSYQSAATQPVHCHISQQTTPTNICALTFTCAKFVNGF